MFRNLQQRVSIKALHHGSHHTISPLRRRAQYPRVYPEILSCRYTCGVSPTTSLNRKRRRNDADTQLSCPLPSLNAPLVHSSAISCGGLSPRSRSLTSAAKVKYKELVKQYGKIIVVFHSAVWVGTLGFFNVLVFNGVEISSIMEYIPFIEEADWSDSQGDDLASASAKFFLAYAVTSVTGPVRFALDVVAAPWLAKTMATMHGSSWKQRPK